MLHRLLLFIRIFEISGKYNETKEDVSKHVTRSVGGKFGCKTMRKEEKKMQIYLLSLKSVFVLAFTRILHHSYSAL
jgi:hypothetical protein